MTLTAKQLEQRRKGLSSSDIPAILGFDPFGKGPFEVWLEKVHPEQCKQKAGEELEIGSRLEPMVANWCTDLYEPIKPWGKTLSHHREDWMLCTPDYANGANEPWEIKAWTKDPGDYVEAQVRWQMAVLDKPRGHIGWWRRNGYEPPEHRVIERDPEAEKLMVDAAKDFWFGYCVTGKEPPVDASDACGQWFAKQRIAQEHLIVDDSHEITRAVRDYRISSDQVSVANEVHAFNSNRLKSLCRDLKKVSGPFGSFSYPFHKGKKIVEWETIARRFMGMIVAPDGDGRPVPKQDLIALCESIIAQHTRTGEAYRQIHPSWSD